MPADLEFSNYYALCKEIKIIYKHMWSEKKSLFTLSKKHFWLCITLLMKRWVLIGLQPVPNKSYFDTVLFSITALQDESRNWVLDHSFKNLCVCIILQGSQEKKKKYIQLDFKILIILYIILRRRTKELYWINKYSESAR